MILKIFLDAGSSSPYFELELFFRQGHLFFLVPRLQEEMCIR